MDKRKEIVLLLVALIALVVLVQPITLFEDGSIQLFNRAGWGFCLLPEWGC